MSSNRSCIKAAIGLSLLQCRNIMSKLLIFSVWLHRYGKQSQGTGWPLSSPMLHLLWHRKCTLSFHALQFSVLDPFLLFATNACLMLIKNIAL